MYDKKRIESVTFQKVPIYGREENVQVHYILSNKYIYRDRLAKFSFKCNHRANNASINRLELIYSHVYIDEVQDCAGYDLELMDLMLKSSIQVYMIGDPRQATYSTTNELKNKQFKGIKIVKKFKDFEKNKLLVIEDSLAHSYRCNQEICNLADSLYPELKATTSKNQERKGHDGVFCILKKDVEAYLDKYQATELRYDKKTSCFTQRVYNMGESKGLTFNRVLIYPTTSMKEWIKTANKPSSLPKLYVAITRAKYSVAFVVDTLDEIAIPALPYHP